MLHFHFQPKRNQRAPPKHAREQQPFLGNRQRAHSYLQDSLKQRDLAVIMVLLVKTPKKRKCRLRPFNSGDILTKKRRKLVEFIHFLLATAGKIFIREGIFKEFKR